MRKRLHNAKYEPAFPRWRGEAVCMLETVHEDDEDSLETATDAGMDDASLSFFSEGEDHIDDAPLTSTHTEDFEGVWNKACIEGETLTWNEGEVVAIRKE